MSHDVPADRLFQGSPTGTISDVVLRHADGAIIAIDGDAAPSCSGRRSFVIPALVNAHDHARPTASSFGVTDMPLESWMIGTMLGTPPDPYLAAARSLARSARAGCGAVMVHYTRPSGKLAPVDEARQVAKAASDVGIRMAFALAVRDQNPIVYGESEALLAKLGAEDRAAVASLFSATPPAPRDYVALVDEIAAAIAGPAIDVQYGPAGVQWCSRALLQAIADASHHTGRRVHMHLLETIHQRRWADRHFPGGIVRYLKDIGLLSARLTLAHCVHARPDELEMIADAGARIVTNFSSNMHLHSGLAPIAAAHACGCSIAVGVDGLALDEDDDAIREMRLVQLMQGGLGFERTWTQGGFLALAVRNGRRATGAPGNGALISGAPADFTVLDLDRLDWDAITDVDPLALLFARGNASMVRDVVVAGRTIVRDGQVTGVDLPVIERELRDMYRKSVATYAPLRRALPALQAALGDWYRDHAGCG